MRNRTRAIAAAAITTALATGSSAAAMASTAGVQPGPSHVKLVSATRKCVPDRDLAARLRVPAGRLGKLAPAVKISPGKAGGRPAEAKFAAVLAHELGVPPAHVRQVFAAAGNPGCIQVAGVKPGGPEPGGPRPGGPGQKAFVVAVAKELNVSPARVAAALRPIFAAGRVEVPSRAFTAAAHSLGVSPRQLAGALAQAKKSLAPLAPLAPPGN